MTISFYNFDAEIQINESNDTYQVQLEGTGSALDFDEELKLNNNGGCFSTKQGVIIPEFRVDSLTFKTKENGSLMTRTYRLECVSPARGGWIFTNAIKIDTTE